MRKHGSDRENVGVAVIVLEQTCDYHEAKAILVKLVRSPMLPAGEHGGLSPVVIASADGGIANRFAMRLVRAGGSYAFMPDQELNIGSHVEPGAQFDAETSNCATLMEFISATVLQSELPLHKPLWRAYVSTDFTSSRHTVIVLKYHLALSDAVSLVRVLFNKLADSHPDEKQTDWLKPRFGHVALERRACSSFFLAPAYILSRHFTKQPPDNNPIRPSDYRPQP